MVRPCIEEKLPPFPAEWTPSRTEDWIGDAVVLDANKTRCGLLADDYIKKITAR